MATSSPVRRCSTGSPGNRSATRTRLRRRRSARRVARRSSRACTRPRSAPSTCGRRRIACPSCRGRTSRSRRSTSRRFPSTFARPATTRRIVRRPTTNSACRSRSGTRSGRRRTGATGRTSPVRSSRCSISRSPTRVGFFRAVRRARGSPSSRVPQRSTCRRTIQTPRRCGKSSRACTTTSPTWTARSARSSSSSKTMALPRTRSSSIGATTATACRGRSDRSTILASACRS